VPWPDYRAVWRWHFYAGLVCIPFVVVLALSGVVYLFKAELEAWQERRYDSLATGTAAPPSAQVAAVLAAFPRSRFEGYEIPAGPGRAARVLIDHPGDAGLALDPPVVLAPEPGAAGGRWTAKSQTANRPRRVNLVIDGTTGTIESRDDFSTKHPIDKAVAIGIALHEGRLFGWPNQLLGLLTALGLVVVCMSAVWLWLRRRDPGTLGAPPPGVPRARSLPLVALMLVLGALLPLFGLSLVVVLLLERFLLRRIPAVAAWLASIWARPRRHERRALSEKPGGGGDRRRLDAQDVPREGHPAGAGPFGGRDLLGRESPLGADEHEHRPGRGGRRGSLAGRIGNEQAGPGRLPPERVAHRRRLVDHHQPVAAALLAGLDHRALQPGARGGRGKRHSPGGDQRHQPRHAEFGELLDHPLLPRPLGERDGERERCPGRDRFRDRWLGPQLDPIAVDRRDLRQPAAAGAVEEHHPVADLGPQHAHQMARLVAAERGLPGDRWGGEMEAFAHRMVCRGTWTGLAATSIRLC
jgi:hypothetical protein